VRRAVLCAFIAVVGWAQNTGTFEVASVKSSPPFKPGVYFGPPRGGPSTSDPGQITWTYATLKNVLMTAYDVKNYQINGPDWLGTERYDFAVKVPAGATKEQVRTMWQNLLGERFGVALHRESKEFSVEELLVGKGGPKLKESKDESVEAPPGPPKMDDKGQLSGPGFVTRIRAGPKGAMAHSSARAQSLSQLTTMLGSQLGLPVLDKTGLTGRYDFELEFAPDLKEFALPPPPPGGGAGLTGPADTVTESGPDITTAVQQQLGLKLVAGKAKLDVLVIDKAEKMPTAN
jgi:uncharacterized protein (TIGR03435 family)